MNDAKALFEQYNPDDESQRPADWTQEKAEDAEFDFYDLEAAFRELKKEVDDIEALKTLADAALVD